jgi:CheY-like chemotaxis protein
MAFHDFWGIFPLDVVHKIKRRSYVGLKICASDTSIMAKVLIVDDHQPTASALQRLLRIIGHNGVCVENGAQALRSVFDSPPDLVVLDVMMPGMTGLDVLRALRSDPRLQSLPVVIYTAAEEPSYRAEALRLGAQEFCVKGETNWAMLEKKITHYLPDVPPA